MRYFNKEGPTIAAEHYHVPPLSRIDLEEVRGLIARKRYFVLHAPRQTGKTTVLKALRDLLNENGEYRCVYVNVEPGEALGEDVGKVTRAIAVTMALEARQAPGLDMKFPKDWKGILEEFDPLGFRALLTLWAASDPRPLVLLIDEIDALIGDSLLLILRQLRAGYPDRPGRFPHSVILCGVRDVRDYRIKASSEKGLVTGGSAFNIKAASLRLGDFSKADVRALLGQHAAETGQRFAGEAVADIVRLSQGQPWLVNALAHEACFAPEGVRDRSREVAARDVEEAAERLILRRDTHLDQLAEKLKEPRVRGVIEPLLTGADPIDMRDDDDLRYVRDLGLVTMSDPVAIANPIYREVVPRQLTSVAQAGLPHQAAWYVGSDGRLQVGKLMAAFQNFFRENSEHWLDRFQYREAGPHLLLQAFLQRVVNSGGRIEREYGVGRRRMDLGIVWPVVGMSEQRAAIECKLIRSGSERAIRVGVEQTAAYMDVWGADEGHLAVFDRRAGISWEARVFRRDETFGAHAITVWGM